MEGSFQGDLADVVRASGGGVTVAEEASVIARVCDFPVEQLDSLSGFGDPFSSMRDPLLVELEGIRHGDLTSSSSSSFHGDFIGEIRDERASSTFDISCSGFKAGVCDGGMSSSSPKRASSSVDTSRVQISSPRNPILKRRKSQAKKVVCIPAPTAINSRQGGGEVVPSDLWAWRKYGQKPIKGSPYPRGYYRCSSSKGCSARKQVERSRTDPNMLVITYTSEHNHPWPTQRNSLAGSSRISTTATTSSANPKPTTTTTVKEETDYHVSNTDDPEGTVKTFNHASKDPSSNMAESNSSVKPNHDQNDVVVPNQLMMDQLVFDYDKSYRPVIQDEVTDNFFADLTELEQSDPLMLADVDDPFSGLFDWSINSNATTTTNSDLHEKSL